MLPPATLALRASVLAALLTCCLPPVLPAQDHYAVDKASCPAVGKHLQSKRLVAYGDATDAGLRNEAKRHVPAESTPTTLTLADFAKLQADVDAITGVHATSKKSKFEPNRDALRNLKVSSGTVSEGDLVQLAATLTAARDEHKESVNCEGKDGFDIHINVGPGGAHRSEYRGVVVEMIPQLPREHGWDSETLTSLEGRQVLVVGGLTYDNEHFVNKDPRHRKNGQPARMSLWEIHPVTQFYVCVKESCDPTDHSQWQTLAEYWADQ